jgi:hypothetical protein
MALPAMSCEMLSVLSLLPQAVIVSSPESVPSGVYSKGASLTGEGIVTMVDPGSGDSLAVVEAILCVALDSDVTCRGRATFNGDRVDMAWRVVVFFGG